METHCQLGNFYFLTKDDRAQGYIDTCLDKQGEHVLPDALNAAVTHYQENQDEVRLLASYRLLAGQGSVDPLLYVNLAKAELAAGNLEDALNAVIKAADIDPSLRPAVQAFYRVSAC